MVRKTTGGNTGNINPDDFYDFDRNPYQVERIDDTNSGQDALRQVARKMVGLLRTRALELGREISSWWPPVSRATKDPGGITYYRVAGGDDLQGMAAAWTSDANTEFLFVYLYAGTAKMPDELAAVALLERLEADARSRGLGVAVESSDLMGQEFYAAHGYLDGDGHSVYKELDER